MELGPRSSGYKFCFHIELFCFISHPESGMIPTMHIAYGFGRILLFAGFLMLLVSAMFVSASARSALRHNKVLRIRGGGFHLHEAAQNAGSIKDLPEVKKKSSASFMRFADVAVAAPHQECNATQKTKRPYQYYF